MTTISESEYIRQLHSASPDLPLHQLAKNAHSSPREVMEALDRVPLHHHLITSRPEVISFARETLPPHRIHSKINAFTDFSEGHHVYGNLSIPLVQALTSRRIHYHHLIIAGLSRKPDLTLAYLRQHARWQQLLAFTPEELDSLTLDSLCPHTNQPCTKGCGEFCEEK